ncbi:hypothetical protein Tco_1309587 [Tanacetum coccineum]
MMNVAFDFVGKDDDGLGYGLDRSMNLWVHGRDIFRDIFGHNLLHEEFGIDFCNEIFEFFHQHGVIGIDVASTGGKIELENSQNNALAKLPMLKLGEYEM